MFNFMSLTIEKNKEKHKSELLNFYAKFKKNEVTVEEAFNKLKNGDIDPANEEEQEKYYYIFDFVNINSSSLSNDNRKYWQDEDNQNKIYAKCSEVAKEIIEGTYDGGDDEENDEESE